ncbi:hypothetical protein [Actinomadura sp. WMMA1423]|uniref:hypothetical protein n=1 Tax=Actinomadura sp. WMMA1423 TaxID=2591108 RepID=UPI00114798BB|nr:hypothetical protein [Actinomadura sp. WMMA1423]
MSEIEHVARAAVDHLVRGLANEGGPAERPADGAPDAVHDLIVVKLGADPALAALTEQAPAGRVSDRTVRRVADAVADAADGDPEFAERLRLLVRESRLPRGDVVASGERSVAVGGDVSGNVFTGDGATYVSQRAEASGHGRVYQAGRDQTIHDRS